MSVPRRGERAAYDPRLVALPSAALRWFPLPTALKVCILAGSPRLPLIATRSLEDPCPSFTP